METIFLLIVSFIKKVLKRVEAAALLLTPAAVDEADASVDA